MFGWKIKRIYLDTAAATNIDPAVFKAMKPYLTSQFGNPSSLHQEGVAAKLAVLEAREKIASLIDAHSDEIVFTSGGTEGDNLAIVGVAHGLLNGHKISKPGHIITSAIEHRAVLSACAALEKEGWRVTYLPVDKKGIVDLNSLKESLRPDTALVSVIYGNNEIGTIEPLREIAKILRNYRKNGNSTSSDSHLVKEERLPYFHTDACQAPRFLPLSVAKLGVDLMTLNGSKIYGPKGTGCLYVRRNTFIEPLLSGGGQEKNRRSGTENVAGIVGFARALDLAIGLRDDENARLTDLRNYFISELVTIDGVKINGSLEERLANNVNATFKDFDGEFLVLALDAQGIACSTGSACSSRHQDDSHVIMALGEDKASADSALRFSLDRKTTKADLNKVLKSLKSILKRNKKITL